jgi:hypothetical protein
VKMTTLLVMLMVSGCTTMEQHPRATKIIGATLAVGLIGFAATHNQPGGRDTHDAQVPTAPVCSQGVCK